MRRLQLLIAAIHCTEPDKLIKEIENTINGELSNDLIGDLDALDNLQRRREQYGRTK